MSGRVFVIFNMAITFAFIILVGNYLSTIRPNLFVGIRLPHTLASEKVWRETHWLASRIWVMGGVLGLLLTYWGGVDVGLTLAIILIIILFVPFVFSIVRALYHAFYAKH